MKSPTKTAYCFLVSNESRDFYLLIGFIYYLEKFCNTRVTFEFVWDAHKIRAHKPDLVILPNTRGNNLYFEIGQYCVENNILVYAHESEGNFNTKIPYEYWGYNLTKETHCPVVYSWNERVKTYLIEKIGIAESIIKISGAPGVDKYIYGTKADRNALLSKYGLSHFNKVVGYAGWAFGKIENKELDDVLSNIGKLGEAGKKWMIENRDWMESCLKMMIERYPDTLFILKKHPRENFESDYRDSRNEMNRIANYPNVLYLKDQEDIQDLIQISDVWTAFESTSILEAWLHNKPTIIINQTPDFSAVNLYEGSLQIHDADELTRVMDHFLNHLDRTILEPESVLQQRANTLKQSFGFVDGLNHIRCAHYFEPYLNAAIKNKQKPRFNIRFLRLSILLHVGKVFYVKSIFERLPKFKKTVWIFENRSLSKMNQLKKTVYSELDIFYAKNGLDAKISANEISDFIASQNKN